jgi:hypothetical protein
MRRVGSSAPAMHMKFGDKIYQYDGYHSTKEAAKSDVAAIHKNGYYARIVVAWVRGEVISPVPEYRIYTLRKGRRHVGW